MAWTFDIHLCSSEACIPGLQGYIFLEENTTSGVNVKQAATLSRCDRRPTNRHTSFAEEAHIENVLLHIPPQTNRIECSSNEPPC